jgi:NCAIR mutase (PurE)-related protein
VDARALQKLLEQVKSGELPVDTAVRRIADLPVQQVADFAQLDGERALRQGVPEVIFGQGKSAEQIGALVQKLVALGQAVLVTRMDKTAEPAALAAAPQGRYEPVSRTFSAPAQGGTPPREGVVAVVCAGTTDIPVAEEACATAQAVGAEVKRFYDVGVSGLHRVLRQAPALREADAIVVCAGMEGALPSVVGGLVARPVIAVPTSVGYGVSLGGIAALLAMLNSCAANVSVVNIDNGFGAGFQAGLIARQAHAGARAGK